MIASVLSSVLWGCTPTPPPQSAAAVPSASPGAQPSAEPPSPPPDPCEGLDATAFDFPVGRPDAEAYYDAQPFGRNRHLGSDWNGTGGGNTDHGDPVYAAGSGRVRSVSQIGGGWGLVLRIVHRDGEDCVESLYAHLSEASVASGAQVQRGDRIGAIGDAGGQYWAHLHFEIRDRPGAPLARGYGTPDGHVDPTAFIVARRPER